MLGARNYKASAYPRNTQLLHVLPLDCILPGSRYRVQSHHKHNLQAHLVRPLDLLDGYACALGDDRNLGSGKCHHLKAIII